jgi:hypothetical protein
MLMISLSTKRERKILDRARGFRKPRQALNFGLSL